MVQVVRNSNQIGVKHFVCDKKDELSEISLRTTLMGTTCYVIEEGSTYILNGSYQWVKKKNTGSSGGGSTPSSDPEENEYSMDGGEI